MKQSFSQQHFSVYIFLIGGMVATLYLLFIFSNALWKADRKEQLFAEFQKEIERLEDENKTLSERYALQKTPEFLDKYAKTNLGKVNPGEKVILLPQQQPEDVLHLEGLSPAELQKELLKQRRIPEQWWYYFFEQGQNA